MRWSDNIRRVAHLRARIFRHPLSRRTVENLYFFYRTYCKFGSEVVTGKKGKSEDDNWNQTRELGRYISRERNSGESFEMRSSRSSLSRVIESVNFSWNLPSLVPPSPIHRMVNDAFRKFCDEDRLTSPHRPTARIQILIYRQRTGCIYTIETDHFQPPFLFLLIRMTKTRFIKCSRVIRFSASTRR